MRLPKSLLNLSLLSKSLIRSSPATFNRKTRTLCTNYLQTPRTEPLAKFTLNLLQRRGMHTTENSASKLVNSSSLQLKKRPLRKKTSKEQQSDGHYNVYAFGTAEEYDLEGLHTALTKEDLYGTRKFFSKACSESEEDVLYVRAKYRVEAEPHDIFFFREGSVVLWNCTDLEIGNVLQNLKQFEVNPYDSEVVVDESEIMLYNYTAENQKGHFRNGNFHIQNGEEGDLERYTFSNAMTTSVKLGIWEAALEKYVDSMAFITEDLKRGNKIRMTRAAVLRKTGELFALKHLINLRSDLLDTPDFYWDREQLETLFLRTSTYFAIQRRTKVMNEKLNHCVELAELVSSNLNDAHHIRLEWMIIVLIMVEVVFEILHYIDRFVTATEYIRDTKEGD